MPFSRMPKLPPSVLDAIATEEKIEAKDEEKGKKVIEFVLQNAKK